MFGLIETFCIAWVFLLRPEVFTISLKKDRRLDNFCVCAVECNYTDESRVLHEEGRYFLCKVLSDVWGKRTTDSSGKNGAFCT